MSSHERYQVDLVRFSLLVRWRAVHVPFEEWKFLRLLPENGYIIQPNLLNRQLPYGAMPETTALVGNKGGISLILDATRAGLQLEGLGVIDVLEEFENIEKLLLTEFAVGSKETARFYEFDAQALVWSPESPIESIRAQTQDWPLLKEVGRILKKPVSGYSLKAASQTGIPTDEDWLELELQPAPRSPTSAFVALLVCRNPDRKVVFDTASRTIEIFRLSAEMLVRQ